MTIASFLFVIATLFLGACYFFRHVANGVDSDDELENENNSTPAGSVAQTVDGPVGDVITLTPEQLSALIESRARSMLVAQQTDRQKSSLSSVGASTMTHSEAKKEPQMAQNMPKLHIQGAGSEVSHVSFKAPQPLYNQIPEVWFEILEQQFQVAGITKESTKYSHAISALDARLHNQFANLIIREKGDKPYSVFKQEVSKGLGESDKSKLNNLLHGLFLGDRKPSQLLELFRRDAGTRFGDDSIRQLWLQRLPQQIQLVLTPFEGDLPLSVLAERADNLIETLSQAQIHSVASPADAPPEANQSNSPSLNAILAQVVTVLGEVSAVMAANGRSRSPGRSYNNHPRKRSQSRETSRHSEECFYHRRFGKRALKCVSGCKHNATFVSNSDIQIETKK